MTFELRKNRIHLSSALALLWGVCALGAQLPARLSETGLYKDTAQKKIQSGVRPYSPQYPLWSDGAQKNRWVFLPPGKMIGIGTPGIEADPWDGSPNHWLFPVGTKFWKEFVFEGAKQKRVETRFLHKTSEEEWLMGTYLWNAEETEASLAPEDGVPDFYPMPSGKKHDIPSQVQCDRCHRRGGDIVLGFDAIQLSNDRDPLSPHSEVPAVDSVSLVTLLNEKLIAPDSSFEAGHPVIPARSSVERAALGYLHSNCSSCHNPYGTSIQVQMNLRHSLEIKEASKLPSILGTVLVPTQFFFFPGEKKVFRIIPGNVEKSALIYQMKNWELQHMPPLGAKTLDNEAIALLEKWVRELN